MFGKPVTFRRPYRLLFLLNFIDMSTVGIIIHALSKNNGCCCDKQILIFTPTSLLIVRKAGRKAGRAWDEARKGTHFPGKQII